MTRSNEAAGRPDLDALHAALIGLPGCAQVARDDMEPLDVAGIAHDHIRVRGLTLPTDDTGPAPVLLRAPRLSQWGLAPAENLAYQHACFTRAAAGGVTPRLLGAIEISNDVPMGALLVEEIAGRKPRLPGDMAAIAKSLARLHTLPVPPPRARPPLQVHDDAVAGTLQVIETQAAFLAEADLKPDARTMIEAELAWSHDFSGQTQGQKQPPRLVATDAHPGNFLIAADGCAVLVDLEKMLYGAPAIDLAHASLYTSTMWDPDVAASLSAGEVADFLAAYFEAAGPALASDVRPWVVAMRRLTWLRTLTWCLRWRVLSRQDDDWSAERLAPPLRAHIQRIVADYVTPARIAEIRSEWEEARLEAALAR